MSITPKEALLKISAVLNDYADALDSVSKSKGGRELIQAAKGIRIGAHIVGSQANYVEITGDVLSFQELLKLFPDDHFLPKQ